MSFSPPSFTGYNLPNPLLSLMRVLEMAAVGARTHCERGAVSCVHEGGSLRRKSRPVTMPLLSPPGFAVAHEPVHCEARGLALLFPHGRGV